MSARPNIDVEGTLQRVAGISWWALKAVRAEQVERSTADQRSAKTSPRLRPLPSCALVRCMRRCPVGLAVGESGLPGVPLAEEQDPTTSASALLCAILQGV
jgi:hypothetical protein